MYHNLVSRLSTLKSFEAKKQSRKSYKRFASTRLDSGLTIVSVNEDAPTATVSLFVNAGSRYENKITMGSTHMLKHLAFRGTKNKLGLEIVRDIEATGSDHQVNASREYISYNFSGLKSRNLKQFANTLSEVIAPRLWEWEVDAVKGNVRHENEVAKADSRTVALESLHQTVFKSSGLANSMFSNSNVDRIVAQHVHKHVSDYFFPGNRMVVATSGVNHDAIVEAINQSGLSNVQNKAGVDFELEAYEPLPQIAEPSQIPSFNSGETLIQGSLDTVVALAFPGASVTENSYYTLHILRNYLSKKLGTNVLNLSYTDTGLFVIMAESGKDYTTSPGAQMINSILSDLKTSLNVSSTEFALAKNQTKLDFALANEDGLRAVEAAAVRTLAGVAVPDLKTELSNIEKITIDQLKEELTKTLNTKPALSVVGDTTDRAGLVFKVLVSSSFN
eukprot:TRINITY_DN586_c0_g1_i1.p1 TRINITY_DN586_c0_g1~~TRINITY_DN586_c0_g1_i1.p1  ORF type:complete len:447 (+),score=118.77 TRINITY_DN586_c0_g1_i1:37-1377(+)